MSAINTGISKMEGLKDQDLLATNL